MCMTLLLAFLMFWMPAAHPVHVSVTSLDVDENRHEILITQKMYTEDFTLLFYHLYEKNIKFIAGKDLSENELGVVSGYMETAFILEEGKNRLPLNFTGKDQDEESIWLHYSCKLPESRPTSLILTNILLMNLFEDQTNLVIVSSGQHQKGFTFTVNNWKYNIDLPLQ